jgi:hypothetical protein
MRKKFYWFIEACLAKLEDVRHINLWNSQLEFLGEEEPFETPAVFIEFQPIEWRRMNAFVSEGDVRVVLHIVTDSRVSRWSDVVEVFDLIEEINLALHGEKAAGIGSLIRTESRTDSCFGELMHNVEIYYSHVVAEKKIN